MWVKDVEGKTYVDFLAAYSAVNQGHRHPKIINALIEQTKHITLTSRAFHSAVLPEFLKKLSQYTGYESVLPMNTGAEAVETSIKLARRWGYMVKNIPEGMQEIIVFTENFHGRTTTIVSFSTDSTSRKGFGPFTDGFKCVEYGNILAAADAMSRNTCAILVEPIQGEAGVKVPPSGYLRELRELCDQRSILFISDEIQTGFCRTGRKFAVDHEDVRPDVLCLGKALGGGVLPVSAIVADRHLMDVFDPGSHGSTFGGNPLACAVAIASLEVLDEEHLAKNAEKQGQKLREELKKINCKALVEVRGRGLLNAIEFEKGFDAWQVCISLMEHGLLAKQTHGNIIRFTPPLVINDQEMQKSIEIITRVLETLK